MSTAQPLAKYTLTEYLDFEAQSETKHEYFAGEIFTMAGASPTHNRLCFKLAGLLDRQLEGGHFVGYSADQKIWIEAAQLNTYADLTIVCGQAQYHPDHSTLLINPRVLFEVLLLSTMFFLLRTKSGKSLPHSIRRTYTFTILPAPACSIC